VDFGQRFLGLSLFLIAAALMLTGLLFLLSVDQRTADIGIFAALGFPRARVRRLVLAEGAGGGGWKR
jgi:ABC-type antimicrobial peptide transport system permease subunit